ncbi:TIR domain-containing protein [Arthrobacter antibioticus]|uniref:hypothetical protein n=1 Tax=Arthrobacter sp. H35-MC1 TaxID=3046203 RepID=UPI0024B88899|nr:hypothetical protein [Arthrobacter sp. H35-MC1]MDJ0316166.1 hypothetical protein [Arthrobacter sp. H35-MC1]
MKVFVSWSKNSRGVGSAVAAAVREIFDPVVDTFISQEIQAGSRGLEAIDAELNDTDFGIICLTRSNQTEQWINYEAGALSRQVADKRKRMGVFLVDFGDVDEVNSPMNIFQCKMATFEGLTELMTSLNELGPNLKEGTLSKRIASAWPDVETAVTEVKAGGTVGPVLPPKSPDEKLDEILGLVKAVEASLGDELQLQHQKVSHRDVFDLVGSDPVFARSLRKWMTSPHSDDQLALSGKDQIRKNRDGFNAKIMGIMEDVSHLGEWGDLGVSMMDDAVTFKSDIELPDNIRRLVVNSIARNHPNHSIDFQVRPKL